MLAAAVVVTSATMAAALTLLGAVEARRQPMALVLLAGAALLTAGRGLGTAAILGGAAVAADVSRFLVCSGLWLLAARRARRPGRGHGAVRPSVPGPVDRARSGAAAPRDARRRRRSTAHVSR